MLVEVDSNGEPLKLNFIARHILEVFKDRGLDDAYIASKASDFEGQSKYETLTWVHYGLDAGNTELLAKRLNVEVRALQITSEFLNNYM